LIAYITSKKAKLKPDIEKVFATNSYAKYGTQAMYDFPADFNKDRDAWMEKEKILKAEYEKKKQSIVDQLHLSGDAETALSLINTIWPGYAKAQRYAKLPSDSKAEVCGCTPAQ